MVKHEHLSNQSGYEENRMMRTWRFAIYVVMALFMYHPTLAAEDTRDLIIVRGDGFWPPYEWAENGVLKGFHIDLLREVAAELHLQVHFKSYPWKRAINMVKSGEADAITYLARTAEREQFALYLEGNQLHLARIGFFTLKKREHTIHYSGDLEQLQNSRICTQYGQTYGTAFEQATYLMKDEVRTEEQVLKMLLAGRCDIAVGYLDDYKIAVQQKGLEKDIVFLIPYLSEHPMYVTFSKAKKHEKLATRFAEGMKVFKNKFRYQELLKKYNISE